MRLLLFGPPRLETSAGQPVAVDTRKAVALAAYLAAAETPHSRDHLATLFWPESDGSRAKGALRRTLSTLKQALGGRGLEADSETIILRPDDDLWVDLWAFRAALAACAGHGHPQDQPCPLCVEPLRQAVTLYTGDFLAGFSLKDSAEFDDWHYFQAESLRRAFVSALDRLVTWESSQQRWDAAIAHARRRLAVDTLHEPAHRTLMRLYALAGQPAAALRQYRECVRILDAELGVPPLDETTALYDALLANRFAPADAPDVLSQPPSPPPSLSSSPPPDLRLPLVGRDKSWRTIQSTWRQANRGGLVALSGEAGAGKSRLLDELQTCARSQGATTALARCFPGEEGLAFGPLLEALQPLLGTKQGREAVAALPVWQRKEVARLFPTVLADASDLSPTPPLDSPGGQARFFQALADLLAALLRGPAPGVLAFDDLHWADSATMELLAWLVRRLQGLPFCLALTWRSGESDREPLLHQLVQSAQRNGQGVLLTLERLELADVAQLLQAGPWDESLVPRLYAETEGIPFLLAEQLAALPETLDAAQEVHLAPASVRELFATRLESLDGMAGQVLSAAAVIGRSFDLETVQAAAGRSEEETVQGLETLVRRRLVVEQAGNGPGGQPRYDFSHEKLRELVYAETALARRRLLHRRVGESLARRRGLGFAGQAAFHFRWAGLEEEAAQLYAQAGDEARQLYANAQALAHYRLALALGHPDTIRLRAAEGELLTRQGNYGAALLALQQAAAGAEGRALAQVEEQIAGVHQRLGEWKLAAVHGQAGLAALAGNEHSELRARLLAGLSLSMHRLNDDDRSLALAEEAAQAAEVAGDTQAQAEVWNLLGLLARSRGDQESALRYLQKSLAAAATLPDPGAEIAARNNLALALADQGDFAAAQAHLLSARERCAAWGDRHREAAIQNNLADLLHRAGDDEQAMAHLKQAVILFAEIGEPGALPTNPEIWKLAEW
ncbi:AAA family ATPase [Litorilinea aerophila]|nr:AAA family ATPase [Litorilinea aerophila]MCC9074651.1 AAA family ATPase [Litorilinea aerophila]